MGSKNTSFILLLFFFLIEFAYSSSYVSYDALEFHGSTGRSLLQAKRPCSVNFEGQNYTIITSRCKGPNYNTKSCCDSFMEFACPFSYEINDMSSDCADVMFSYINLYGKYPPGLFANMCKGSSKDGIECPNSDKQSAAAASFKTIQSPLFFIISTLLLLFLFNVFF